MGGFVDKAIEVGTLGLVKDASGTKQARKDAFNASASQLGALQAGQEQGRADLDQYYPLARKDLIDNSAKAQNSLTSGFQGERGDLNAGFGNALAALQNGYSGAENTLTPFYQNGQQAGQLEAALSGALGPQAQAQAFQNYQESPEVAYMREMGEKSALRGASSQGMSLSGSVLEELNRRGTGLAMQGFGDFMSRLSSLSGRGQQAGQNLSQLRANQANGMANLYTDQGRSLAATQNNYATNMANSYGGLGQGLSNLQAQLGNSLANISTGNAAQQAQIHGQLGVANANAALSQGQLGYGLLGQGIGAFLGAS